MYKMCYLVNCLFKMIRLSKLAFCVADFWNMPGPKSSE